MGNYTCHADGYEQLFQTHTLQVNGRWQPEDISSVFYIWNYRMLCFLYIQIWTPHGQQRCTVDFSWGPDQHGSAQRVLTISTHRVLLTHDTWTTALFTWSIYFRSSLRGEPLLLAPLMPFPHRKMYVWDLCDTVVWGCCKHRMIEQNSFGKEHRGCLWDEFMHLQPAWIRSSFAVLMCLCWCWPCITPILFVYNILNISLLVNERHRGNLCVWMFEIVDLQIGYC